MNNHAKRDWRIYNRNLVNRGSITLWISEECLHSWVSKSGKRGRPKFSTAVIQAGLIMKAVYHLPLRALQGFLRSILNLLQADLKSPHYSLFCKRAKEAAELLPKLSTRKPLELAIDSSGLKISGEGEWKVKIHGKEKRRGWIKLHMGVDPKSGEIIAIDVTNEKTADNQAFPRILKDSPKSLKKVYADGAYDRRNCRKALSEAGIQECILPQKNGRIRHEPFFEARNDALRIIRGFGGGPDGADLWKKFSGYHRRSLAETLFSRFKRLLGDHLASKKFSNLQAETLFKCHVLNKMLRA